MCQHSELAVTLAKGANAGGFRFGAVIFKRKKIIACGWCQAKSHPKQAHYMRYAKSFKQRCNWLHAEIHALVAAKQDVSGCDIVIGRISENKVKNSYPCRACFQALLVAGIENIWYYKNGVWVKECIQ